MAHDLIIQDRSGITKNYGQVTEEVTVETNRTGSPGKMNFIIQKTDLANFHEGNVVRYSIDGTNIFYGYIFSKVKDRWGTISVTAYDQIRYLKAKTSSLFVGATVGDIIRKLATDFQLKVGTIEDTGYKIPYFIQENKTCLDIINTAMEMTTVNTGRVYIFYDDFGALSLRKVENLKIPTVVGTKSFLTDYEYQTDIDSDTYNRVKLVRPNKETGKADTYIFEDSSTQSLWGLLQYYDQVDEELNPAQITQLGQTSLKYYNRVLRTLNISSIGIPQLRAGNMLMVNVPDLGDLSLTKYVLLDKVEHTFTNNDHTMELECRVIVE